VWIVKEFEMLTPRIGLVAVALACVIAAGTGAYIATRHLNTPATATSAVAEVQTPAEPVAVHETEALVDETPAAIQTPAQVAPTPLASEPPAARAQAPRQTPRAAATPATARRPAPPAATPQTQPPVERAPEAAWNEEGNLPGAAESREPFTVPNLPSAEAARPPQREFLDLVVARDSVMGLQLENTVSSESAAVEDRVSARVSRDVSVDGLVAIAAGSRVLGAVTLVERGGKVKERARLGVRFHTLVLADGTSVQIQTDTVYRDGEPPGNASAAKIGGGAVGGAIIGGILGGARGAVIGGSAGAGAGTAAVMAGSRRHATLAAGSSMTVRVLSPVTITVEQ
jgi:type IV secretory pathway VirB10-like protein